MELKDFASVPFHILGPKDGRPVINIVQDTALGVYRITKDHVRVDDKTAANLQMVNSFFSGELPAPGDAESNEWTGKQLFSAIMPPGIFTELGNNTGKKVVIRDSELLEGTVDKKVYGTMSKGLLPIIQRDYSPYDTRRFLDNTQRLVCRWLMTSGFSVGVSDLVISKETEEGFKQELAKVKDTIAGTISTVLKGKLENSTILSNQDYFESELNRALNKVRNMAGEVVKKSIDDRTNRLLNMIQSGSKGNDLNLAQMTTCVGQQNQEGKRIPYGFTDRTLPHYCKYDDGPEARGFVENSFLRGLTPQEVYFHAVSGREGLIDTAVKTSSSGYTQRRLVKAMEDAKVYYDNTVRNAAGTILQFLYGEDGMEGTKVEWQHLPYLNDSMTVSELQDRYLLTRNDPLENRLTKDAMDVLKSAGDWVERCRTHFTTVLEDRDFLITKVFKGTSNSSIQYPVPFTRIIQRARERIHQAGLHNAPSDLDPVYILDTIDRLSTELHVSRENAQGTRFFEVLLRGFLSPKQLMFHHRLTRDAFDWVIGEIKRHFVEAICPPGEMVGVVAAQSIGEPVTQLSAERNSVVRVMYKNKYYNTTIGDLIDNILEETPDKVVNIGNDSVVLDMDLENEDNALYIVGVSNDEKTSWKKISQVSRHPANGGLVKVTTRSGKTTCATLSHSFLKRSTNGIIPIEGYKLRVGDRIPVAKSVPDMPTAINNYAGFDLDAKLGWIIGAYIADGSLNGNHVQISKVLPEFEAKTKEFAMMHNVEYRRTERKTNGFSDERYKDREYITVTHSVYYPKFAKLLQEFGKGSYGKMLPGWVYASPKEFRAAVLQGFFDGDGNTNVERQLIRVHSVNERLIDDMIVLLAGFGIFASKRIERRNREISNTFYVLIVSMKEAKRFMDCIDFSVAHKRAGLIDIVNYNNRDNKHDELDRIDMIPELGETIAYVGKRLELPGQSRNYGRWIKKAAIGRRTLQRYINIFEEANKIKKYMDVNGCIAILKQAAESDVVWDEIVSLDYLDDPKEFVYDFTVPGNDSFMVDTCVLVHNTLNSVDYETEMVVRVDGNLKRVNIGEWIDEMLQNEIDKNDQEEHPNNTTLGYLKNGLTEVLSVNEEGLIDWKRIEAVTRHPPINKDGSNTLLRVKTQSGREVIATKAKAFLQRRQNRIVEIPGEELEVGQYLPVSAIFPVGNDMTTLDVKSVLSPKEFLMLSSANIPENFPLDEDFGFFCGAYLAEGCLLSHHVIISNNDKDYMRRICDFLDRYDVNYSIKVRLINNVTSTTLRANSVVLATLIDKLFGQGSANKRISPIMFKACDEFTKGLIDGYISGDGYVHKRPLITVSPWSCSYGLLQDLMQILLKYDIRGNITTTNIEPPSYKKKESKYNNVLQYYTLHITSGDAHRFAKEFTLSIGYKQERLNELRLHKYQYTHNANDIVPDIVLSYGTVSVHRDQLQKLYSSVQSQADKQVISATMNETIFYDRIVSIEEIPSSHQFVYDLTVEDTRNFNIANGICQRDTFHHAGIAEKSNVTRGLPRMTELLSVTKNMKNPSLTIFLKEDLQGSLEKVLSVMKSLEMTYLRDLVKASEVFYDPPGATGLDTGIAEDAAFLKDYREFSDAMGIGATSSPWVLRLAIDRAKLYQYGFTMLDIYERILSNYSDKVECTFTDDNAENLVMRIRMLPMDDIPADDEVTALKAIEYNLINTILLKGVQGIKRVMKREVKTQRYDPANYRFETITEYVLDTDGTNLSDILANENVDSYRTLSNDIVEIYNTLGIEAARQALYTEIQDVIKESSVNYRHVSLLVDTMTSRGQLMSIDRHGINRGDVGPMAKSSFEETTDMLINAGIFSEFDRINGVSANIMLGQLPPCGTGDSEILLDEDMLVTLLRDMPMRDNAKTLHVPSDSDASCSSCSLDGVCKVPSTGVYTYTIPEVDKKKNMTLPTIPEVVIV